ncbi:hypothetical protein MHU86_13218 [Fragilaria crotonensis]|nr:hypothetical protein MHU86_13218 [Fragilaria crotonensis]
MALTIRLSPLGIVNYRNVDRLKYGPLQISLRRTIVSCTASHPPFWPRSERQEFYPYGSYLHKRNFSSRGQGSNFKLEALAFSVAPEQALAKFEKWAQDEQGLKYLLSWSSTRIAAAYVPVWSFDVNLRYKVDGSSLWTPSMFAQAYPNETTIYISGLSVYSGHSYRRTLINPIHNTTLVFLGDQLQPFGNWMLREMKLSNGSVLQVFPDPWNATKGQAQEVLRQDLTAIAKNENQKAELQMQVVSAKRVYIPAYIVEYKILGMEYQAFLSGCDEGAPVSGVNHQLWGNSSSMNMPSLESIFQGTSSAAQMGSRILGPRGIATVLAVALQFVANIVARVLLRLPAVAFLGSIVVGFRKALYPWLDHRYASAEWERQREREAAGREPTLHTDDFDDVRGTARRYFEANKARILRTLGGDNDHHRGDFDWYKEWEEWARRQYEQQSQQQGGYQRQQQTYSQQQQTNSQQQRKQRPVQKAEYKWDFDPNDPYSVLGIRRGATKAEVSAAFRSEMLKHHPDTQVNATETAKARAQERSKYITEAYRKIKTEMR